MEKRLLLTADLFQGDTDGGMIVNRSLLAHRIGQALENEDPDPPVPLIVFSPAQDTATDD